MLPALASLEELAARLGVAVWELDVARAQATLDDASALVRSEVSLNWVDSEGELGTVPDVAASICLASARRAYENPTGATQRTVGDVSVAHPAPAYLTTEERVVLSRLRGTGSIWSLATTRGDEMETTYIDVVGSDKPIPFLEA
jgi:hypothetical protein